MGGKAKGSLLVLLAISAFSLTLATVTPSETFSESVSLVKDDVYHLFWKSDNMSITFEVHAKVKGWVGFGLSPNGGMPYSDIVIGWVKDGVSYFKDRWTDKKAMPTVDDSQDWILLAASETDSHTILKFKRPLYSCDPRDHNVTEDTMRVIFAYSDTDPSSENAVTYHGKTRGVKSITLRAKLPVPPVLPSDAFYQDLINKNITIPHDSDTTYWCTGFHPLNFTKKHHLIRVSPIITPGNEAFLHHITLNACYHEPSEKDNTTSGAVCGTGNMPWGECSTIIGGWAVGGGDNIFPDHAGLPFGEREGAIFYLVMDIHYDNPSLAQGIVDSSGLRLWFSPTLRTYDVGLLVLGIPTRRDLQILPAGYKQLISVGHCSQECVQQGMRNESEFQVFSAFLHTHLLGVGLRIRHFRNGTELPYIASDMNYDFNYQEQRSLNPEVTVKKGDSFSLECFYDTKNKNVATFAGQRTRDEMCLAYLGVYPRIELNLCLSAPTQSQMASHLSLKYRLNRWGNAILTEGPHANKSFTNYVRDIVRFPDDATMNKYQEAIVTGQTVQICRGVDKVLYPADITTLETPEIISPYTPVAEPCGSVGYTSGGSAPPLTTAGAPSVASGASAPPLTTAGAPSIASLGIFSILLNALFWQVC